VSLKKRKKEKKKKKKKKEKESHIMTIQIQAIRVILLLFLRYQFFLFFILFYFKDDNQYLSHYFDTNSSVFNLCKKKDKIVTKTRYFLIHLNWTGEDSFPIR
jgi:hypothetical protein